MKVRIKDDVGRRWTASKFKGQIIEVIEQNGMFKSVGHILDGDNVYINFEHAVVLNPEPMPKITVYYLDGENRVFENAFMWLYETDIFKVNIGDRYGKSELILIPLANVRLIEIPDVGENIDDKN